MKLLFYRYGSICEPFLYAAFQEYGLEITEINEEVHNKSLLPSDCVELVSQHLLADGFSLVFSVNFFPAVSDVCNIFHIPYAAWTVDSPVLELYNRSITNEWNRIFLFDRRQYEEIASLNPGHVFYMPLATSTRHMARTIQSASAHTSRQFAADISFLGSLYTEKCPFDALCNPSPYLKGYLNGLMEAQLKVYGYYFVEEVLTDAAVAEFKHCMPQYYTSKNSPFLTDKTIVSQLYIGNKISSLERTRFLTLLAGKFQVDIYTGSNTSSIPGIHNRGFAKTLTEMPLIYHNSIVNLNITSKAIRSGIPLRIWDILGCRGFLITNYQAELPEYFTPGEDIETYSSPEELEEKCRFYLEHPMRAREIAQNGYETVCKHHTYVIRLEQILQCVFTRKETS